MKITASASGIGFCNLLGLLFITLKLCKVISWGWVWVLAPFWISAIFGIPTLIIALIALIAYKRL